MERRPFYGTFAWAYDQIIAEPAGDRFQTIASFFAQHGIVPGSRLLDAGCGTGRYALELAKCGYVVTGLDASPDLLAHAHSKREHQSLHLTFLQGNILHLPFSSAFDGILCRGVLNDVVDEASSQMALHAFAHALRPGGLLLLDVREWHATVLRKTREPLFEKQIETEQGTLTFRSLTHLDHETRQMCIWEQHRLEGGEETIIAEYNFVMRCWLQEELRVKLTGAGFDVLCCYGDYDLSVPVGATDRMIVAASLITSP